MQRFAEEKRASQRIGASRNAAFRIRACGLAALLLVAACPGIADDKGVVEEFPRQPIKVVVPFGAGGGTDTFTRIIQSAIEKNDLLSQPLVVINVPGAGGSIGSRRVKNARPDGYTILQIHEGMLTNKYAGNTNFGPEAFIPIAGTGQMAHVIAVPDDSPYSDLKDLLDAAEDSPDSVVFAVGIGAPSHFAGMMLESARSQATKFRFTQSGGGAKRFASLMGGHCDVSTFSVAEYIEFKKTGLRALAILSQERSKQEPDIPTAIEQGVEVISTNMHFWWAPKGTPPQRVELLAQALNKAMKTEEVGMQLLQLATENEFHAGPDLQAELEAREQSIGKVAPREIAATPNFGLGILGIVALTGIMAFWPKKTAEAERPKETEASSPSMPAILIALAAITYVGCLQFRILDYRIATILFVCAAGWTFCWQQRLSRVLVAILSVLLGFGLHFVFTQVLVIDLP
ncbi:MAG: tripartite tricarboxylate transporter substrate-binding protein [Planctomycetota bacterium]